MSHQETIKGHLEAARRFAEMSDQSMLIYLIDMALIENAGSEELKQDDRSSKTSVNDIRKTFRIVSASNGY